MARKIIPILCVLAVLMMTGCQTTSFSKPADSAHTWINGLWSNDAKRWPQTMKLRVGDGNKVKGEFTITSPDSGNTYTGPVSGEVNGANLKLSASMYELSATHEFNLEMHDNGKLLSGSRISPTREYSLLLRKKPGVEKK